MNNKDKYQTEQEAFWYGTFGSDYIARNTSQEILSGNTSLFSDILKRTQNVSSLIEFGASVGNNLVALRGLIPDIQLDALEINPTAVKALSEIPGVTIHNGSALEFKPTRTYDMVLSKGFLIHINPEHLRAVYEKLYAASGQYICLAEYYNPTPVSIPYRGFEDRLFKRDFAGEMMDMYSDLSLIDYGFVYRRDPNFPLDDVNWFLLEK